MAVAELSLDDAQQKNSLTRQIAFTPRAIAGAVGALLLLSLLFIAIFAPLVSPYDPTERVGRPFAPPSAEHWLGTNDIGQDILSELIYGTRISLTVGILAGLITIAIGGGVGVLSGYFSRLGDWLMRFTDLILVLPFLPLLIILSAYLERSVFTTIAIISVLIWAGTARLIRSQVLTLMQSDYITYARSAGASDWHIISRHILPHVTFLLLSEFVQAASAAILLEASLSFLGLGDPVQKSWGTTLYWAQARGAYLSPAWRWWVLPPGLLIGLVTVSFALLGFAFERTLNPRLQQ